MVGKLTDSKMKELTHRHFERCLVDAEGVLYLEKCTIRDNPQEGFNPEIIKGMAVTSKERLDRLTELKQNHDYSDRETATAKHILGYAGIDTPATAGPFINFSMALFAPNTKLRGSITLICPAMKPKALLKTLTLAIAEIISNTTSPPSKKIREFNHRLSIDHIVSGYR
ncbi:MAG TPA: hypothetical protein VIF12_02920 [Micavibrio sp.]|jgi:hypothetical protein